jgi:hypothetical protein
MRGAGQEACSAWRCFSARSRSRIMAPGDTRRLSGIRKNYCDRVRVSGAQRLRCASLAQTGRIDEARSFLAMIRREQPQLSIELDQGKRALPDAGVNGEVSERHAESGIKRELSKGSKPTWLAKRTLRDHLGWSESSSARSACELLSEPPLLHRLGRCRLSLLA